MATNIGLLPEKEMLANVKLIKAAGATLPGPTEIVLVKKKYTTAYKPKFEEFREDQATDLAAVYD